MCAAREREGGSTDLREAVLAGGPMACACVPGGGPGFMGYSARGRPIEDGLRTCTGAEVAKQEARVCSVL